MKLSITRIGGKLHWFVDSDPDSMGWSYPVFHRGSLHFLLVALFPRLRKKYLIPPTLSDLERAEKLQMFFRSMPDAGRLHQHMNDFYNS